MGLMASNLTMKLITLHIPTLKAETVEAANYLSSSRLPFLDEGKSFFKSTSQLYLHLNKSDRAHHEGSTLTLRSPFILSLPLVLCTSDHRFY